jgi:predicted lysophospholipase L1 biosynthesis ABC-type transport system permease subunit
MPGHIDSPQSLATISWIEVRLLGGLAGALAVVFAEMTAVVLVVEPVGGVVTLPVVVSHGVTVGSAVVMLNGVTVTFAASTVAGVLLPGVKEKAVACVLAKSESDRNSP